MKLSKNFLLGFIIIFGVSFFTFSPSFKLALFGDDWLAFFRYIQHLGPASTGNWNHLTYYLTPYGPQDITMGLLYKIYGFNSTSYYFTSYILRLLAAFSLFPLVYYLTKSKLSAFFASLFFSVTAVGLDTTNWVFNMPTYVTISLFFISLYLFISAREEPKPKKRLILAALLYYFSYITTPIRMHGSLILIFLLEAFWLLRERNIKTLKSASLRFGVMLLVFLTVKFAGSSLGPPEEIGERLNLGITGSIALLSQGRFDFIFHPIVMFGSMISPDLLLNGSSVNSFKQMLSAIFFTTLISIILSFLLLKIINKFNFKTFLNIILSYALWNFIVILVWKGNLASFGNSYLINLLLVGGYTIILSLFMLYFYRQQKNTVNLLLLSGCWMILSFLFAWWWVPSSLFPTTYRYLIVSAAGTATLFAAFISLGNNKSQQIRLLLLLLPFIFINIIATRMYLNQAAINHGKETTKRIWASIPYVPELIQSSKPLIFYFEGTGNNGNILHDVITFGFPPHMALIYNLTAQDPIPVPMSDFKDVVSAITDGKTMPAYGYKAEPVSIDRIYAFKLEGSDKLINITDQVREKLIQLKNSPNQKITDQSL